MGGLSEAKKSPETKARASGEAGVNGRIERSEKSPETKAKRICREDGYEDGREEGLREGIEAGREEGERNKAISAAINLLKMNLGTPEQISQAAGINVEEVLELQNRISQPV